MASQHEQKGKPNANQPTPLRRRTNLRPVLEIHWGDIDATAIRLAIDAVTRAGGAIMVGRTSDGGALSVCILDGDTKIKEYPHTVDEATALLRAIAEEYVDI